MIGLSDSVISNRVPMLSPHLGLCRIQSEPWNMKHISDLKSTRKISAKRYNRFKPSNSKKFGWNDQHTISTMPRHSRVNTSNVARENPVQSLTPSHVRDEGHFCEFPIQSQVDSCGLNNLKFLACELIGFVQSKSSLAPLSNSPPKFPTHMAWPGGLHGSAHICR